MKLKHIPNALTLLRVVLTISLIFIRPVLGTLSMFVFVVAGCTDMLDGPIARRVKADSEFGAEFDSLSDMLMVIVSVFVILPQMGLWSWVTPAVWCALAFKICSAIPGLVKHRKVFFLHTLSNKILAVILFAAVLFYGLFGAAFVNFYIIFLLICVFAITLEEMVIISLLDYPNKNIKHIFEVKRVNEEYRAKKFEENACIPCETVLQ